MNTPDVATAGCSPARPCSPVSILETRNGREYLVFLPHGYERPIRLPVITSGSRDEANAWTWNGSTSAPTLKPEARQFCEECWNACPEELRQQFISTVGLLRATIEEIDGLAANTKLTSPEGPTT